MRTLLFVLVLSCSLFAQEKRILDGVAKLDSLYNDYYTFQGTILETSEKHSKEIIPCSMTHLLNYKIMLLYGRLYRYEDVTSHVVNQAKSLCGSMDNMIEWIMDCRELDTNTRLKGIEIYKGVKKIIDEYKLNK